MLTPEILGLLLDASMLLLLAVLTVFGVYHVLLGVVGWSPLRRIAPPVTKHAADGDAPAPLVTFIVTAYREREVLFDCVDSILAEEHPPDRCHVVLVVDEDDEGTMGAIRERYLGPHTDVSSNAEGDEVLEAPRVTVILQRGHRAGRGKPRALQNAMRYVPREGYVAILDADHKVERDFVARCLAHFEDPEVGVVQAKRYPKTRPRSWIARWDVLEQNVGQIQAFLARDRIGCASFYGSTAIIRADLLHDIGWQNCLAEDTLLNYDVRERGLRVAYEPHTGSGEDHVRRMRSFVMQRRRWAAGHMQVLFGKLASARRAPTRRVQRWESILTLNYYNATLVVLVYWLVRATHYWLQDPPLPHHVVTVLSVFAGAAAWGFEKRAGGGWRTRLRGAVVGTALAYGAASLLLSYIAPAADRPLVPPGLEIALFLAPLAQMAMGYLNPTVRPRIFTRTDHVRNALVLVALAPVMLLVNAYATLTGMLVSIESPHVKWVKTARKLSRRKSPWTS